MFFSGRHSSGYCRLACDGVKAVLDGEQGNRTSFDAPRSMAAPDIAAIRFSVQGADGQITHKCQVAYWTLC
jgi:hypothetical protein